jgi:hypothetical protein
MESFFVTRSAERTAPIRGVESLQFAKLAQDGTELNGRDQRIIFAIQRWPEEDFSVPSCLHQRLCE